MTCTKHMCDDPTGLRCVQDDPNAPHVYHSTSAGDAERAEDQ